VSTVVASHGAQIAMLADELTLTRAAHAEEMDGRINVENLHRLMILGGPYLEGEDLQDRLKQQVIIRLDLSKTDHQKGSLSPDTPISP